MKARLLAAGLLAATAVGVAAYSVEWGEASIAAVAPGRGRKVTGEILPTTLAWYGDSLTEGACNPTPPPAKAWQSLPGWWLRNRGKSGERVAPIAARYFANRDTDCLGEPCGAYVFSGGTNDCGTGDCAPATVLATMLEAVDDCLARERRCIVVDIPPHLVPPNCPGCMGGNEAGVESSLAYNALLAAACQSNARPNRHLLRCVSTYPAMEEAGPVRGYMKEELHCDGTDFVHTSQAGADVLSELVLSALNSFPRP